jgi:hypothetical protein
MPDAYPLGGYEVTTSPWTPEAAAALIGQTSAALRMFAAEMDQERRRAE